MEARPARCRNPAWHQNPGSYEPSETCSSYVVGSIGIDEQPLNDRGVQERGPRRFLHAGMATACRTHGGSLLATPAAPPAPHPGSVLLPVGPSHIQSRNGGRGWARESSPSRPPGEPACHAPGPWKPVPILKSFFLLFLLSPHVWPFCWGSLFPALWPSLSLHSFCNFTDRPFLTWPRV